MVCIANQLTLFVMKETQVVKGLRVRPLFILVFVMKVFLRLKYKSTKNLLLNYDLETSSVPRLIPKLIQFSVMKFALSEFPLFDFMSQYECLIGNLPSDMQIKRLGWISGWKFFIFLSFYTKTCLPYIEHFLVLLNLVVSSLV